MVHQANYLLDRQKKQFEDQFLKEGGFTEKPYSARKHSRGDRF
ncbi:MAG: four helix bundle suffix domain-containing protein [Planctomycetota bacterium]